MIAKGNWHTFLTLKDEKLILVIRKHTFVLISPIILLFCLTALFIASGYVIFQNFFTSTALFIVTTLLLTSCMFGIITKLIIDWYFHVYILTNRKIMEFSYTPLTSYQFNDVMLDRVLCTEVDFQTNGILHDLIDLGDIIITFDRPTHREEFVLSDILGCHKIGNFLTQQLLDGNIKEPISPVWFAGNSWGKRI